MRNARIARVFPRRTKQTPDDEFAFSCAPGLFPPSVDEVHVSVAFTWDRRHAEELARQWERVAPTTIGGPGVGMRGEEFTPGMYLKRGCVITSRGCPNRCWFCSAWLRDGGIRELPITEGWIVQDDNLLACSASHIRAVFDMLRRQPQAAQFVGGLEAARLEQWHVDEIASLRPKQIFLAYDTPDDYEPLLRAVKMFTDTGITKASHCLRCYVLIGAPLDTFDDAEARCKQVLSLGVLPMAMLWRDPAGVTNGEWRRFQREWVRPTITATRMAQCQA